MTTSRFSSSRRRVAALMNTALEDDGKAGFAARRELQQLASLLANQYPKLNSDLPMCWNKLKYIVYFDDEIAAYMKTRQMTPSFQAKLESVPGLIEHCRDIYSRNWCYLEHNGQVALYHDDIQKCLDQLIKLKFSTTMNAHQLCNYRFDLARKRIMADKIELKPHVITGKIIWYSKTKKARQYITVDGPLEPSIVFEENCIVTLNQGAYQFHPQFRYEKHISYVDLLLALQELHDDIWPYIIQQWVTDFIPPPSAIFYQKQKQYHFDLVHYDNVFEPIPESQISTAYDINTKSHQMNPNAFLILLQLNDPHSTGIQQQCIDLSYLVHQFVGSIKAPRREYMFEGHRLVLSQKLHPVDIYLPSSLILMQL